MDQSFGVTTKALTVTGITAESKPYDGNVTAIISTTGATLVGVVGSDVVTLNTTGATGAFSSATVGVGKIVTISGLTLTGTNAGNYTLTQPTATADIYALNPTPVLTSISPDNKLEGSASFTLTVNGSDFVADSKVYFAGAEKATTYVSATRLTASILAADVLASATTSVYVASPAPGGGTSTPQTFTIVPAVTKFVILNPGNGNVDGPLLVTIQAQKSSGEVATGYSQDVTLVASGAVTGEGLVNITNGVGTIEISDTVMENVHLSLSDSQSTHLDVSSTQDISFLAGATKKLTLAGDGSAIAGARTQLTVTRKDQHDNLVSVGSESFNLVSDSTGSHRFYDSASGGNIVTTILVSNGNSSASVWYYDEKAGSANVTVSSNDTNVTEDSATITITPASTASFYLNDPGDLVAGNRLAYTVTRKDQFGNLVTAGADPVHLFDDSANSSAVFYDLASGGAVITSV
ncbi:MAG: YDG domain-containing protein, partial [Candidatus Vogelbacteria bacterium]|nr:YDG domain-containing protein [Candidatus Vogelbacteria bacterium]